MPAYPGFCGPDNVTQSALADGQRTVNWYIELAEAPGATAQLALYPTPGVSVVATASDAPGRGAIACDGRLFCVIGSTVYELDVVTSTLTARGTVAVDSNPATLTWNGDGGGQVFITSGDNGYIFDLDSNVFSQVRTGATSMGAHLDGYFLALDAATSTIWLSNLLDGTTWDPTQFAQRSIASDPWVSMAVLDRYLWLLGTETSEVWYDAGAYPFPFTPHPSGLVQYGCAAAFSPRVVSGALLWLGRTKDGAETVLQVQGFTPEPVSSFAVSSALGGYTTVSDARGDSYQQLGHTFYLLTLPTAGVTWAYDVTPSLQLPPPLRWAERGTWLVDESRYDAWRPLFHVYLGATHYVLDRTSGSVYTLSSSHLRDVDGRAIRRLRVPPSLYADNEWLRVWEFQLLLDVGLGAVTGQGSTPQVALRISTDGGRTYGVERWRSAGALGNYDTRVRWLRCGMGRRWTPEIVVSDPVPWRLLGATVTVEQSDAGSGGMR